MTSIPKAARKTLTLDNGGEFADHEKYQEVGLEAYFCDPYCSWQKGGVENSNGRLRIILPRDTNVKEIEYDKFKQIILNHNSTPRKSLGWLTPLEVFNKDLEQLQYKS
ncbi:IS30 family transposase [Candidatus Megaera polyxenophila]|uniref:IS30 family transposase n=1 Tax=Candidatus Megaera polyxenophila TaxID=988779 RepID=UPI00249D9383|nr:IS30 family transposase [Candidatus Megaera polyxenophila]